MEMKMEKKLISIGLAAILVIGVFAAVAGIASAQTYYNETGKYIEGINVTVNTSVAFNRSCINVPLMFLINNTLNESATSFNVTNQSGLTTNATAGDMANDSWFWVNATEAGTYWVNVSNKGNSSEYVYFTVEYFFPAETIRIRPKTLNLGSKGVFTAFITFFPEEDYNVTDINISTVECEGAPAVKGMVSEEDNGTYIVKFNRQDLVNVSTGDAVELTVTGKLNDGRLFEGNDTIRVIDKRELGPKLLPGHPLYGVKRWSEKVHMFFTFDDDAKARLHIRFSEKRLAEAKAMTELGKPEWAEGLMEDYIRDLNETYKCMQRQKQRGKPVMDLAEYVCNATDEQAELLSDFVDEVPGQEKPHINHAMNASYRGHTQAMREIEEEKPDRAAQLCAEFAEKRMERAMKIAEKRGLNVTEMAIAIPGNPGEATKRVFVSGNPASTLIVKNTFAVQHGFEDGFTVAVGAKGLAALEKIPGIQLEAVPLYHVSGKPVCGNGIIEGGEKCGEPGLPDCPEGYVCENCKCVEETAPPGRACYPDVQNPWGIVKVNGGSGGAGVKVAVLDTGVYKDHLDLKANIIDCRDTTKRGIRKGCADGNGHGTHVSGTILASAGSDGKGIYGVAPEAKLMAIKVCGPAGCWCDDIAAGIRYATDNGANIISMSLGGDTQSSLIKDAIDQAVNNGVLVVAAAGNDGPTYGSIDYPGANVNVIAVGAIDLAEAVPDWSSRGINDGDYIIEEREVEFGAPGLSVESTWEDGCYNTISGTSMATPHVAGLAAKLWQGSASGTRTHLQGLAQDLDPAGDDTATGFGLPIAAP
ncbi:MAG: S8 family serine peptidase [Euryarchaeota archaeon]|nr:S8 family serine peptidase [Euryarchaeota archaeon]